VHSLSLAFAGLKGRNVKAQGAVLGIGETEALALKGRGQRPFRAKRALRSLTQGCALGYRSTAFQA